MRVIFLAFVLSACARLPPRIGRPDELLGVGSAHRATESDVDELTKPDLQVSEQLPNSTASVQPLRAHRALQQRGDDPINVVFATDSLYFIPLWTSMRSLALRTSRPERVHVYAILHQREVPLFERELSCRDPASWRLGSINAIGVTHKRMPDAPKGRSFVGRLGKLLNYARFYLSALLPPAVRKVLYVDVDTLWVGDVQSLWDTLLPPAADDWLCAVNYRSDGRLGGYYARSVPIFLRRYGRPLNLSQHDFNAGVMALNLRKWDEAGLQQEARFWLRLMGKNVYRQGSQSPITLLLLGKAGRCLGLPRAWNAHTGNQDVWPPEDRLVHWNGRDKPWYLPTNGLASPARDAWHAASPVVCGGHGACQPLKGHAGSWACACYPGSVHAGPGSCAPRGAGAGHRWPPRRAPTAELRAG